MPVTLWLWLAVAAGAGPAPSFEWGAVPGGVESVAAPEPLEAAGFPVRLQAVRSTAHFEALVEHFARSFVQAGLYVAPFARQTQGFREVQLTGFDTRRQVSYTVFFQLNPDRTTTVLMTEVALGARRRAAEANDFAPIFPGGHEPLVSRSEAGRSLVYTVTGASTEEVLGFYREALLSSGYREAEPGVFERGQEELQVLATARRGAAGVSVVVLHRTAPPAP